MKNSLTPSKNKQNNFVDIAFYADFGATYGKGYEISNIAYECKRLGILGSVFIRAKGDNKTLRNKQKTAFPFGAFFFKILTFIEKKLFKNFKSRYWQEVFFDFLISRKLRCGKNKLFYGVPRMHHSFVRAKQLGYVTVLHAAEQNAYKNLEILTKVYPDTKFPTIWSKNMMELSCKCYQHIDYVIAHSPSSAEGYIENGFDPEKVFITPMGFNVGKFKPKLSYSSHGITRFLFIGNVTKMKGVHLLIEAWEKIDTSNAELHICGDIQIDMMDLVQNCISNKKNIFFHGYVQPNLWFEKCDVFVFPSLSEGFSRVVIEAAASGLPVIVSKDATDANLFQNNANGFIIDGTPDELIKKIKKFIGNFPLIEKIGKSASEDFSKLTWESFGKNTAYILKNIHENNR